MESSENKVTVSAWVFDLDGTLSDPLEGMLESVNRALVSVNCQPVTAAQMHAHIGPPLEATMAEFAGTDDSETVALLIERYRGHYKEKGYALNSLYPGITDLLQALARSNSTMGVCTAKTAPVARSILENFGIAHYFSFVSGGDIGVSKASQLEQLLEEKIIDRNALMIGDRKFDIEAANANSMKSCGVTWGYGDLDELQSGKPHMIVQTPAELESLLFSQLRDGLCGGAAA